MLFSRLVLALTVWPLVCLEAVELREVKLGDSVVLICNLSRYFDIHWLKVSEGQIVPLMVTGLATSGEMVVFWNSNTTQFEGFMEKRFIRLRILRVCDHDLATYFCAEYKDKHLHLDGGVKLYSKANQQQGNDEQAQGETQRHLDTDGFYHVFASVMGFSLLGMILVVLVVHVKTRTAKIVNTGK